MTSDYTGNRAIAATGNRKQSISTSVVRDILDGNLSLQPLRGTTNAQIAYVSGRFITRFYVKYNMAPPPRHGRRRFCRGKKKNKLTVCLSPKLKNKDEKYPLFVRPKSPRIKTLIYIVSFWNTCSPVVFYPIRVPKR